jgi:hypothetical protein
MNDPREPRQAVPRGLCATCTHVRIITSDRGNEFTFCNLSKTDDRFPRYPRLPVLACSGYRAKVE